MRFLFEENMTLGQVLSKVRKIIDIAKDRATVQGAYFNPTYAEKLLEKVQELKTLGFKSAKTETESEDGKIIAGKLISPGGEEFSLGSILLTGKEVIVQNTLRTVDELVSFIEEEVSKEVPTTVNF